MANRTLPERKTLPVESRVPGRTQPLRWLVGCGAFRLDSVRRALSGPPVAAITGQPRLVADGPD